MTEIWRIIPSYPKYQVSFRGLVRRVGGKILKQGTSDGYKTVCLYNGTRASQRTIAVQILVLEAFIGPRPKGKEACPKNGVRSDNRLTNLYWGTHSQNVMDAIRHGTHVDNSGEKNGKAKLSREQALEVKTRIMQGEPSLQVAKEFSIHQEHARAIARGKFWKCLSYNSQ